MTPLQQVTADGERIAAFMAEYDTWLEARAAAILDALQNPFIDRETACELIDELAEIEIKIQQL
jgi:hypothetical protein